MSELMIAGDPRSRRAKTAAVRVDLGIRLRELRSDRRMSLRSLAEQIGCSASALSQIENGAVWPSIDLLIRLGHHFDCSFDSLLGRTEWPGAPSASDASPPAPTVSIDSIGLTSSVLEPGHEAEAGSLGRDGVAFVFVAEGELTLDLDPGCFVLNQGSTMRFNPGRRARYSNRSNQPVRALWGHIPAQGPAR